MKQEWFIQIKDKNDKMKITIYHNGIVYGKERGEILGKLNSNAIAELKSIINGNLHIFKTLTHYNEKLNNFILKVNDTSRKHRNIKIVGWSQMPKIINLLYNKQNFE